MKVAIDIDEVLADAWTAVIRFHNQVYKTQWLRKQMRTPKFWGSLGKDKEENYRKLEEFCHSSFFRKVKPIVGSQKAIRELREKLIDLIIITTRPSYLAKATEKWLEYHFPGAFSAVFYAEEGQKSKICLREGVPVLIDDSLEESHECASKGIRVVLLDCPWNQRETLVEGVHRVFNWSEAVQVLLEI